MGFWGVKVEAGKPLKVNPNEDELIHISQISLDLKGEKGETAIIYVKFDGTKFCIGSLSQEKVSHMTANLFFGKEFELSHSLGSSGGTVHFTGYTTPYPKEDYLLIKGVQFKSLVSSNS